MQFNYFGKQFLLSELIPACVPAGTGRFGILRN